jgi:hypothetical protein
MDVSARSIDLLTALTDTVNNPQGILQLGLEIGRWLGREKLSETQLQTCLEKAKGLALANSRGQEFFQAVNTGMRRRAVGHIFAQPSGSLGRLMASDPYLCWMISTIACLFEFHGEDFASNVLCAFIMQAHLSQGDKALTESQLAWHPLRLQLKPVIDKIVSSVWFNVVNSGVVQSSQLGGLSALSLPVKIKDVCPKGHYLEWHKLGMVLSRLRHIEDETIIQSKHIVFNLTIWLLYHFRGRLRVVVSGNVVYNEVLGQDGSTIEYRVSQFCEGDASCDSEKEKSSLKIFSGKPGNLKELFCGQYDSQMASYGTPQVRHKLYQSAKYPHGASGKDSIRILVRRTAFRIVEWLLNLRLNCKTADHELSFEVLLDQEDYSLTSENLVVQDILARVPSIMNLGWRDNQAATVVYTNIDLSEDSSMKAADDDSDIDISLNEDPESILSESSGGQPGLHLGHFPILRDLLDEVMKSCRCYFCERPSSLVTRVSALKPGCLQNTAFMEVMLYIAQSISDAFGADDCSAAAIQQYDDLGVIRILKEAISGKIRWKTWFNTASQVVLGCPSISEIIDSPSTHYVSNEELIFAEVIGPTVVAIQHGNLAVVAPWLDLSLPLTIRNCFSFKIIEGRLGLIKNNGSYFQSLQGDTAIIETRHSEDVQSFSCKFPLRPEAVGSKVSLCRDNSQVSNDLMIEPYGPNRYVLLMRISSDTHSRFVDVARAMIKISQPAHSIRCNHPINKITTVRQSDPVLKMYNFDELLGRWPDVVNNGKTEESRNEEIQRNQQLRADHDSPATDGLGCPAEVSTLLVSQILDSYLKYNIALALVYEEDTILNHGKACMACILEKGTTLEKTSGLDCFQGYKWVICRNEHREIADALPGARKKIKAAV